MKVKEREEKENIYKRVRKRGTKEGRHAGMAGSDEVGEGKRTSVANDVGVVV
jgi:hypothetical protein